MANTEKVLTIRIGQKSLCVFSCRELDDDHALRPPIALHYGRLNALDDIFSRVFIDERRDTRDVWSKAREIVKAIKDSKLKVQASIQGDFVRVAGKDRDTLQSAIQLLRNSDFGIDMQFTNYRTT